MSVKKVAPKKEIFGWCMFDFANSAYTTVIITVVFSPIFTTLIVPVSDDPGNPYALGNTLWALSLAISYVFCMFLGLFLGNMMDMFESKKKFLFFTYAFCIIFTAGLWFVSSPELYLVAFFFIIFSNLAFSLSENFISSFLPFLGPSKALGKISGYAWAIGYFGGLLSVILVKELVGDTKPENFESLRMVGPITALFFMLAGIPTFLFVKEPKLNISKTNQKKSHIKHAFKELVNTFKSLKEYKDLSIFLVALFFSLASLYIVISFTFIFGKQVVKITDAQEVILFVLTQISAAAGSLIFGLLQSKFSALKSFMGTIMLWIVAILLVFFYAEITNVINSMFNINITPQTTFLYFAVIAGSGLGAVQSSSRTIIGMFSPNSKSGEFFGLWGLSGKTAAAVGLFAIAWLSNLFGLKNSFLIMVVFFILSLVLTFFVNEKRGIELASSKN